MLRFLSLISLLLTIAFTGIGLLICKQWGWPEYASPELYLVYDYVTMDAYYPKYMIANVDGGGQPEKFSWHDDTITALNCSPDGRTFAFMTDKAHLYMLTAQGIVYDQILDQPADWLDVMNNQSVSLELEDAENPYVTIHPDETLTYETPSMYQWLASEKVFMASTFESKPYIEDAQSGLSAWLDYLSFPPPLSPDATKTALNMTFPGNQRHIYIADFLSHKILV